LTGTINAAQAGQLTATVSGGASNTQTVTLKQRDRLPMVHGLLGEWRPAEAAYRRFPGEFKSEAAGELPEPATKPSAEEIKLGRVFFGKRVATLGSSPRAGILRRMA
jgi:hypothetical protein